ncbi:MAG: thioesterase domain-containing protein [Pseudomonadota bacterium]
MTLNSCHEPDARLFCFPFAGTGPSLFRQWVGAIPSNTELIAVAYPGREARAEEPLFHTIEGLVEHIIPNILPLLDRPFVFFGYSMGALVSFELARMLSETHGLEPQHLFVSAARAPHLAELNPIHELGNADFLRSLIRLNGMPREVLASKEMIRYAFPILRADFAACETYRCDLGYLARFPITVFGGERDARVDKERLEAWRNFSAVSFRLNMVEGDHFFLRTHRDQLLGSLNRALGGIAY